MRERQNRPPPQGIAQRDFYNFLRRLPSDVLRELYKLYVFQKERALQRQNQRSPTQMVPVATANRPPPQKREVIVLRRSIFFLLLTIFSIEILFDLFYFGLRTVVLYLPLTQQMQSEFAMLLLPLFIGLNIVKIIFMFVATLGWLAARYEIRGDEIRYKYGLLFTNEKIFICTYTQEVNCNQSVFGRMFNYGTIEIFNPTLKETIYMDAIPNPHKYTEIIKGNLPDTSNAKLVPL